MQRTGLQWFWADPWGDQLKVEDGCIHCPILLSQTHLWSTGNTQCLLFFHPESVWKKVIFQTFHHAKTFIHKTPNIYQNNLRSLTLKKISKRCEFILPYWLRVVVSLRNSAIDKIGTSGFGLSRYRESNQNCKRLSIDCQTKPTTWNHRTVQKHLSGRKKSLCDRWKGSNTSQVLRIKDWVRSITTKSSIQI